MKRLIDDKEATVARLHELYGRNPYGEGRFEKCIEELYAPNPVKHTNMSQCTCASDKEITCIVHPTTHSLKEYIAYLEERLTEFEEKDND